MQMLTEQEKNIAVQFDVCKREVLDDIFNINKGCKLLVLDSNFSLQGHIIVEGQDLSHNLVSFEYTDQIFQNKDNQIDFNVEVFIDLGSPPIRDDGAEDKTQSFYPPGEKSESGTQNYF